MKQRVSAIIISEGKIWLIKRVKPSETYYVFPGGTVEEENLKHAMWREVKEELSVDADIGKLLFIVENLEGKNYFFEINGYIGTVKLGGPELERTTKENQYILEEIEITKISDINLYPKEAITKLRQFL